MSRDEPYLRSARPWRQAYCYTARRSILLAIHRLGPYGLSDSWDSSRRSRSTWLGRRFDVKPDLRQTSGHSQRERPNAMDGDARR